MYIDFGMDSKDLEVLIHNIGVKHKEIGIRDSVLADRLGKLFEGIYSDFNQGTYTFGMFKRFLIRKEGEDHEQDFFIRGTHDQIPNKIIVHSLFINTLLSLRRITDETRAWKKYHCIKKLQYTVQNEIRNKIPQNQEVVKWFDDLEGKYEIAKISIAPLLFYIDERIAHHNRKWDQKLLRSTSRDIETVFESVNAYNNAFKVFYDGRQSGTMISNGEIDTALFLSIYYKCKHLSDLRNELLDVLGDSPEDLRIARILSEY